MNVQQLHVFMEVCSGRTLADAAVKLGLKQPTVSFHLRKLEEELGVTLFRKQSRSLQPTEAAADLLPYARKIVFLVEEAKLTMQERREQGEGRLRLGASYTPATYVLPPHLAAYRQLYPGVNQQLTVKQAGSVLFMLRSYEIDVGIVSLSDSPQEGLVVQPLVADELKLLLAPQHALANQRHVSLDEMRKETFLLHETGSTSRTLSDEWANAVGLKWESVMELGAIETIKETLKCNMGIGILPHRSVRREIEAGELVMRDLPQYVNRRHICLAYREGEQLSPHVRSFIAFMRRTFVSNGKL
ncbi:DNA-binding transcriptional LysR family regulator [Paenibacillus endophyticus]|uniref:DNA-binding transcriptional LysR family regulator n=1 Tax=Paenibacillus endophyticus TaxID=1294268 RepID=A0A7W5G8W2_9BACL|nr:LysR family transcriptional regulator [Paenibacillus endophyticus]MBB3150698.1 DNA-binding transcriptional LysR family regulator [Paenibacillus endophyticus]